MSATLAVPTLRSRAGLIAWLQRRGALAVLALVAIVAGLFLPNLLRGGNLANVVVAASFLALVTIGQSFVIIMGGFDLAIGAIVGLSTLLAAWCAPYGALAAIGAPVLAGLAIGLLDGVLIAGARMAPFIVTLAAMLGIRGLAVALAGEGLQIDHPGLFGWLANGATLGLANPIWIVALAFAAAALILNRTEWGAALFAIGGNEEAARMMGVRVTRVKILTYAFSGGMAGFAGALLAAHLNSGLSSAGTGYELQSIAAAVIGGVLLTGGVGTMLGALSGALLLGLIDNIIDQIGTLSAAFQGLASGAFLLAAVLVQAGLSRRRVA